MSNISRNKISRIEYYPRNYDSEGKKSLKESISNYLWQKVQQWSGYNDQICFIQETGIAKKNLFGYEVKEMKVVSTGVTKEMLEKYQKGEQTETELITIKNFLKAVTGQKDISHFSTDNLKYISKLILDSPDNLGFLQTLLLSPKLDILLPELVENPGLLKLETSILEKIFLLDDESSILKELREYPLEDLNNDLLKEILELPEASKKLGILKNFPGLLNPNFNTQIISKTLTLPNPSPLLEQLLKYPELLQNEKIISNWDNILGLSDPSAFFEASTKYPAIFETDLPWNLREKIMQNPPSVLYLEKNPELFKNETVIANLEKIVSTGQVLRCLDQYPDLLKNKAITSNLNRILTSYVIHPDSKLEAIGKYPDLLNNDKITWDSWGRLLHSSSLEEHLKLITEYPDLLQNESVAAKLDYIIHISLEQTSQNLNFIKELLKNEKTTSALIDKILPLWDFVHITQEFKQSPHLFEIMTPELWNKILDAELDSTSEFLGRIAENPTLLENEKVISKLDKILRCKHPEIILELFSSFPHLLDLEFLDKILLLPYPNIILESFENFPDLRKLPSELLEKILISSQPAIVLQTLGQNPDLRKKIPPEILNIILDSYESGNLLKFFEKNPTFLENKNFTPEFLSKILPSPKAISILETLNRNPQLLTTINKDRWDSLLRSKEISLVLNVLVKYPSLVTLNLNLWNTALTSPNPDEVLLALGKYPELIKMKQFTPQLFSVIHSMPDFSNILATFNKYPYLLTDLPLEDLDTCFASPKETQKELLALGKQLAIDALKKELSKELEKPDNLQMVTALINKGIDPRMIKPFFTLGDKGVQYAQMYLAASDQKTLLLNTIMTPYLLARLKQVESNSSGPFVNFANTLKDLAADEWNRLPMREDNIDDQEWKTLKQSLGNKLKELFPDDKDVQKIKNTLQWFDQIPHSRDAEAGLQIIRRRVASIIDFIIKQEAKPNEQVNEALIDEGIAIAKELDNILADGGTACPDRAAVALETAEMYAKAFTKGATGNYVINVVVNEFKRNLIAAKFVDPKQGEAIETLLYHMLLLNGPLGLEYAIQSMLYQRCAIKTTLEEAMLIVYSALTVEDLIGFVQDHPLMQPQFSSSPGALLDFKRLISDKDKGLGLGMFGSKEILGREIQIADITQLEIIDSDTGQDNSEEYIKRLEFLITQAPSAEALSYLKERFWESDYVVRDELYEINAPMAEKLDKIATELDNRINNFKTEKTKELLTQAGFLSDIANYKEIDDSYWDQIPAKL